MERIEGNCVFCDSEADRCDVRLQVVVCAHCGNVLAAATQETRLPLNAIPMWVIAAAA